MQTAPLSHSGILTCSCGSRIRTCVRLLTGPAYETGELGHCSIPRFCRSRRARTSDLRFWRPTFYQLNYTSIVEVAGLEPTKPNGGRFTIRTLGAFYRPLVFKTSAIDQLCQTSNLRKQKDSRSTFGRFARKEPPKPFGFTRSCSSKRLLRRRASSVSPYHSAILPLVFGCKGTIPLCSLSA